MRVQISKATLADKLILRHLLELYQYDLSDVEGTDVNALGLYGYKYLEHYWTEPRRHPFLARVDGQLAGFVLVNQHSCLSQDDGVMTIAEFFVMKKYRGRGVGQQVATKVFDTFPGPWEVRQLAGNLDAQAFWRKVIGRYTGDRFEESFLQDDRWHGPVQVFESSPQRVSLL